MRISAYLTTALPPHLTDQEVFDNTLMYAMVAEELGVSGVWLLEHHFTPYGLCSSPLTMAGFVLGRTNALRVGTAISIVTLDHPVRLAEKVALLDRLSGGRFDFGIGRGSFVKDFVVFDVEMSDSHAILDEYTDIMLRAWTDQPVFGDGRFARFPAVNVLPKPRTQPHPPIYCVGTSPTTIEWAATRGFGLLMHYWLEDEVKVSQLEWYRECAMAAGRDPGAVEHVLSGLAYVADSRAEARSAIRGNLTWWFETGKDASGLLDQDPKRLRSYSFHFQQADQTVLGGGGVDAAIDKILDLNPVGTPEDCAGRINEIAERTGVRHFALGFEAAFDRSRTIENMERFLKEVVPLIDDRLA